MLLKIAIQNWVCFRDRVELSLFSTREQYQKETLAKVGPPSNPINVLPVAAIYGGNASGKSALIDALRFLQECVLSERPKEAPLPAIPYKLSLKTINAPSEFSILFLASETFYRFDLSVSRTQGVVRESLAEFTRKGKERLIYSREGQTFQFQDKDPEKALKKLVAGAVPENRLFLEVASKLNVKDVQPAADWFSKTLQIIKPDSQYQNFHAYIGEGPCAQKARQFMQQFGTGIASFKSVPTDIESLNLTEQALSVIDAALLKSPLVRFTVNRNVYVFRRANDPTKRFIAERILAVHCTQETSAEFNITEESDGTVRLLDLIPAVNLIEREPCVIVIDEFERSLHPRLCEGLLEDILSNRVPTMRSQLLFTTHNPLLMRNKTLRRDATWLIDHRPDDTRDLYPLSDFPQCRKDSDLLSSYLLGRVGGIPYDFRGLCTDDVEER